MPPLPTDLMPPGGMPQGGMPQGGMPPAEQGEPDIMMAIPAPMFEMAREFVSNFKQVLDATAASQKAGAKASSASSNIEALLSGGDPGLAGFEKELSAASNQSLGY